MEVFFNLSWGLNPIKTGEINQLMHLLQRLRNKMHKIKHHRIDLKSLSLAFANGNVKKLI